MATTFAASVTNRCRPITAPYATPVITRPLDCILPGAISSTSSALLRAHACCVNSTKHVCDRSAAARNRNHVAIGIFHTASAVTPPRSSTITPKPPACRSMSAARSAFSIALHGCATPSNPLRLLQSETPLPYPPLALSPVPLRAPLPWSALSWAKRRTRSPFAPPFLQALAPTDRSEFSAAVGRRPCPAPAHRGSHPPVCRITNPSPRRAGSRSVATCSTLSVALQLSDGSVPPSTRFGALGVPIHRSLRFAGTSARFPPGWLFVDGRDSPRPTPDISPPIASDIPRPSLRGCGLPHPPPTDGAETARSTIAPTQSPPLAPLPPPLPSLRPSLPSLPPSSPIVLPGPPHRTQSIRSRSTPAAAIDSGSSASVTSTQANTIPSAPRRATNDAVSVVRPELSGPTISVIAPNGNPPQVTASTPATPVGTRTRSARTCGDSAPGTFA